MTLLNELYNDVNDLRERVLAVERIYSDRLKQVLPQHIVSARNLVHYLAIRSLDLRPLQEKLSEVGLSSLGRMEAGVLGHLNRVISILGQLTGRNTRHLDTPIKPVTPQTGRAILDLNASEVLGDSPQQRLNRIMVTMPSEAAKDPTLVKQLHNAGMDIARINCAHDDESSWAKMIENLRQPSIPYTPLVAMDLAGPKLRTGPLQPGPEVTKVRPVRDGSGHVQERSFVILYLPDASDGSTLDDDETLIRIPVDLATISQATRFGDLGVGMRVKIQDARGAKRQLDVEEVSEHEILLSCDKTVYWETGTKLSLDSCAITVRGLEPVEQTMRVYTGDHIILTRDMTPVVAQEESPYRIGCSLEEAFEAVKVGEKVWIDDGKIGTIIRDVNAEEIFLEVTAVPEKGAKLRAEKGINFPDSVIELPALTEEDLQHLPFVSRNADIVNMSFVQSATDVKELISTLESYNATDVDIVLKIETAVAFEALPDMLLEAMRWRGVGVMIARGDLAVEAGWERLAELQEEILWLCEAAHVPVIWATQVLETLAKTGVPSRAEITDAAMSQRAEAVMLNKGPYIVDAIDALKDILGRMDGHLDKKRDILRKLHSWSIPEFE